MQSGVWAQLAAAWCGAALADCFGQLDNNGTDRNLLNLDFYCGGAEPTVILPAISSYFGGFVMLLIFSSIILDFVY